MNNGCRAYCSHGGICTLPSGHDGNHAALGLCTWSPENSISKEVADETLRRAGVPEELLRRLP